MYIPREEGNLHACVCDRERERERTVTHLAVTA